MEAKFFFEKEVNNLLLLTDDELYLLIGDDILGKSTGLLKSQYEKKLTTAKKWFKENKKLIQDSVCKSITLQYYLFENEKYDKLIAISSLLDLIINLKLNVSPLVVAILIFREGFKSFCSDYLIH
jgi:hypothetical protein